MADFLHNLPYLFFPQKKPEVDFLSLFEDRAPMDTNLPIDYQCIIMFLTRFLPIMTGRN